MSDSIILSENDWTKLSDYYSNLTPGGISPGWYILGNHIDIWKQVIAEEFKAQYFEDTEPESEYFYGGLIFDKPEYKSWFILKVLV